jgi:glycine betaine/proline transport system substrate-binding protein
MTLLRQTPWILCLLAALVALPGAGRTAQQGNGTVTLAYVEWSTEIASNHLVQAVLREKMGYDCRLKAMAADEMWKAVATGEADAMVSAWLPTTHGHYYERYRDRVENLGPNMNGTKIGLVVPKITEGRFTAGTGIRNRPYIKADSIPELKEYAGRFEHRIVGIDPEAGIMKRTRQAMRTYGLDAYRLVEGSEVSMVAELSHAIRHQRWIVVTGWLPHWIFARWDLKFLEDPKDVYGEGGHIATVAREGLKQDMPRVYSFLDRFHWTPSQMGQLMLWIQEEEGRKYPYEKALRWMRHNPDWVRSWLE